VGTISARYSHPCASRAMAQMRMLTLISMALTPPVVLRSDALKGRVDSARVSMK